MLSNGASAGQAVKPGQTWRLSGWIKCKDTTHLDLVVMGMLNGRTVDHGLASDSFEWLTLDLSAGKHTIKLTNADGRGMNLDYLALYPVR